MSCFVYVLGCSDGSLYAGMTTDWKKRVRLHYYKLPGCAKYTRSREVESIAALWEAPDKTAARKLEARFKLLKKDKKLLLIAKPEKISEYIPALSEYAFVPVSEAALSDCI